MLKCFHFEIFSLTLIYYQVDIITSEVKESNFEEVMASWRVQAAQQARRLFTLVIVFKFNTS